MQATEILLGYKNNPSSKKKVLSLDSLS